SDAQRVGGEAVGDVEMMKKSSGGSSSELVERTCQEMAIDAEEMTTQEESGEKEKKGSHSSQKDDLKTGTGFGTGPGTGTGTGPWPLNSTKTGKTQTGTIDLSQHKSVFDTTATVDVPSQFEIDSVKRLQKMSKESMQLKTQNTTGGSISVEMGNGSTYKNHQPATPNKKKKKKKKRDRRKEEEVCRWNEAIAAGLVRPRKDDETVDEVQADWGEPM
ncbi:hypothetical protein PMAYCL1PPCAC_31087, partial [Pristionchus mayeri]